MYEKYIPYKLFVDDDRDAPNDTWTTVRTAREAYDMILERGLPTQMSFDYILNGKASDPEEMMFQSGYTLALWIVRAVIHNKVPFFDRALTPFHYTVHSQFERKGEILTVLDGYFKKELQRG